MLEIKKRLGVAIPYPAFVAGFGLNCLNFFIGMYNTYDIQRAVEIITSLIERARKGMLNKAEIPDLPMEGGVIEPVLNDLLDIVRKKPESVPAVLMLLGDTETNTVKKALGTLGSAQGISLNIVDAEVFRGIKDSRMGMLLDGMTNDSTKVVVVGFTKDERIKGILDIAESKGAAVVKDWELKHSSPEEVARANASVKYQVQVSNIDTINVLTSLVNVDKWRPGVNQMIRYIVCGKDVTITGILKLYNKLPEDIKRVLEENGITAKTIERSEVVNTDGRFNADELKQGAITEIAA